MSKDRQPPSVSTGPVEDRPAAPRSSNRPLMIIFVLVGLVLVGTIAYAFMMQIPGSMPGMGH